MEKKMIFSETYKSNAHQNSEQDAKNVLDKIREAHPASSGWVEFEAYVEQIGDKWRAVRKHARYA